MIRFHLIALIGVAVLFAGCATQRVAYLDPDSNDNKITRVNNIDQQDWNMAAARLANRLIYSDALTYKTDPDKPNVIAIAPIRNKTQEHIDTDLLLKKIRVTLNKSGKALTTTAVSVGGPEDAATMRLRKELRDNDEFDPGTVAGEGTILAPGYSLSGKIIQQQARAGRTRQSTFAFQMSLTDVTTGLAVWEEEYEIVKQGNTRASVRF